MQMTNCTSKKYHTVRTVNDLQQGGNVFVAMCISVCKYLKTDFDETISEGLGMVQGPIDQILMQIKKFRMILYLLL